MPIDFIIFDCDGTLVDTESIENTVLVEYAREFGLRFSFEEAVRKFAGVKMADCVAIIEDEIGRRLPEDFVPNFRRRCVEEFEAGLKPIDGVVNVLRDLTIPYCVATNGPREKIELTLKLTGLREFFGDRVFSAYEIDSWKPAPDLFLHAAERCNADPKTCLVVEDSLPGIEAGLAAGMTVVGFRMHELLDDLADHVHQINEFSELTEVLDRVE